jgi:hypothetical protein
MNIFKAMPFEACFNTLYEYDPNLGNSKAYQMVLFMVSIDINI